MLQISHFFNLENGDTSKFPFHIGSIVSIRLRPSTSIWQYILALS